MSVNHIYDDPESSSGIELWEMVLLFAGWYALWQLIKWIKGDSTELTEGWWPVLIFLGWPIVLAVIVGYRRNLGFF